MSTFTAEQLNFFKFSAIIVDEFPNALRHAFVNMWDTLHGHTPGCKPWDDSPDVRGMFLSKEGGMTKVPTDLSFKKWDCTALLQATLFAKSFSRVYCDGIARNLSDKYVKPRGISGGSFHPSVQSPYGDDAETFALALDQLRLLRNTLFHSTGTGTIDKTTFDHYIQLAKEAFEAISYDVSQLDFIGTLAEEDFPTSKVEQLEEDLKKMRDTSTKLEEIENTLKDIKQTLQRERDSTGSGTPISCLPDKKPLFVGRELECDAVLNPLVSGDSRLVNIWGPPGFGKTSVAIEVAHHLRERNTPTYFISVRGVKSKEEIVSKLLSIFAGTNKQATHFSPFHTVIQCLREFRDPFVVIFDNADDVLESGNGPLRDDMLQVTQEILEQCNLVRLLFTTRESMDYLHHSVAITVVKVEEMDEVSSSELVRLLLPDVQDDDCKRVVRACGRVPLAMKLMCGIIKEENSSATKLCKELRIIPVVAVLDDERLPNDLRLRNIIDKSYERLAIDERRSFVSLAVFPGFFGIKEATSVLRARDTRVTTRFLKSLQQKSLINYHDHRESFSIHPLLQSFIAEKCSKDDEIRNAFNEAQLRLHEYYVSCFAEANEQFLTGNSVEAFAAFRSQQDGIMSSLAHGTRSEALYRQVIDSISNGELFLYSLLCHEEFLFHDLYDTALKEAKKQGNLCDEYALKAAKAFGHLGWFFARSQVWDESPQPWTGKMLCYRSVYQLLCGNLDEGVSSLEIAVDLLSSGRCDEQILKILANHILAVYYTTKEDEERIAYFENLCRVESLKSVSSSRAIRYLFSMMSHPVEEIDQSAELSSVAEQDATMFALIAKLLPSLYKVFANPEVQRKATLMTTSLLKQYEILKRLFENGALPFQVLESCCDALRIMNFAKEAAPRFPSYY